MVRDLHVLHLSLHLWSRFEVPFNLFPFFRHGCGNFWISNSGWLTHFGVNVCVKKCEDLSIASNVFLNFLRGLNMLLRTHLSLSPISA